MSKRPMIALAALLACTPLAFAANADMQQRVHDSKVVIKKFMTELKGHLKGAMKEGGPTNAIKVCNHIAPEIAKKWSEKTGWKVGRTSLKYRNPKNAPDVWEQKVLEEFEARKAKGEDPKTMAHAEVVEQDGKKVFRFMKAIPTQKVCLKCHGENIGAPVKAKLDELYPGDQARGFKLGDIRGAFTIIQPM